MACVLILEDDERRRARFLRVLEEVLPGVRVVVWSSAKRMLEELEAYLPQACLISLDHDLYPADGDSADPGDGWEVAQALAARAPSCPVIVHSSNADRSRWMQGELQLGRWSVRLVAPLGEDWIESHWASVVRQLAHKE